MNLKNKTNKFKFESKIPSLEGVLRDRHMAIDIGRQLPHIIVFGNLRSSVSPTHLYFTFYFYILSFYQTI